MKFTKAASIIIASFVLIASIAACNDKKDPPVTAVSVGVGAGTISGNAFAPRDIQVPVGTTVTFTITSDEAHTVTFPSAQAPAAGPAPTWPVTIAPGASANLDGAALVNTGIVPKGSKFDLKFTKEGSFNYICAIHPGMAGKVDVVASNKTYTTAPEAATKAKSEQDTVLALEKGLRDETKAKQTNEKLPDGSTRWTVPVGATKVAPTGYLELLEYFPPEVKIKAGDTVRWVAETPHSVTFGQVQGDPTQAPAAKPSESYDGKSLYHSGIFAFGGPTAPKQFELKFGNAGSFNYACALHGDLGHKGKVIVE